MRINSRSWMMPVSVLGCLLLFTIPALCAGEQQLGTILYSRSTTVAGIAVPNTQTLLQGDVVATAEDGSAMVALKSGARLKIGGNSSVRFLGDGARVKADLLSGAVVSESTGKPSLTVETSKYQFAPSQEENCRFSVALQKQTQTVAEAMTGDVLVRSPDSLASFILPAGKYAAISANAGQLPAAQDSSSPDPTAGIVTNTSPSGLLERGGAEGELKMGDVVNLQDVVRTMDRGRVRIKLLDGSFLNVGSRTEVKVTMQNAASQQTQVSLPSGLLRAEVVHRTTPGGSFQVQTPTATVGVVGSVIIVLALQDSTQVWCVEGVCTVQTADGTVTLQPGQSTSVHKNRKPGAAVVTTDAQLQAEISLTSILGSGGGAAGAGGVLLAGWHIGSLSTAASVGLAVGVGAGVAGAVTGAVLTTGSTPSPSAP